jgi:hypothetical protein
MCGNGFSWFHKSGIVYAIEDNATHELGWFEQLNHPDMIWISYLPRYIACDCVLF